MNYTNPLYSVYFAPRGYMRMNMMGAQIAQQHLTAFDRLIGVIGESGSGKSLLIKGMFPGIELTNDDNGVNVRPLPLLEIEENGFYQPHTYHVDIRFEAAFTQMHTLAEAILNAVEKGRRVVVEHFEMIYPALGMNAELLIGVGDEIIVTRPTLFGPEPEDIAGVVYATNRFRRMAHSAEDLLEHVLHGMISREMEYMHGDVRHGFQLIFREKPDLDLEKIERSVLDLIALDLPIGFVDDLHIRIGDILHRCTGPRMHVARTGQIEHFRLLKEIYHDVLNNRYCLVGLVGGDESSNTRDINSIRIG